MYSYGQGNDTTGQETHNLTCITFSAHMEHAVFAIKLSLSSFAIVVNLSAIILVFLTKKANKFMYRLVVYLLITDILQAIAIILISLPIAMPSGDSDNRAPTKLKPGRGWSNECVASGFISVMTLWMGNIIVFWIALYLARIGYCLYRRTQNRDVKLSCPCSCISEVLTVLFLLVLVPIIIAIIPFFIPGHGNMYGLSGLWCWIKVMDKACGDLNNAPLIIDLIMFYAPLIVIVLFTVVFSGFAVTCCCRGAVRRHDAVVSLRKSDRNDIIVVLVIPLVYCGFCLLLLINRIHSVARRNPANSYPDTVLWMTHTIADPVRVILPALAYLFNPLVWKDICHARTRTSTPAQDSSQPLNQSLKKRPSQSYGSCNDTATENLYEDDDVSDDEYTRSLLKMNTKT